MVLTVETDEKCSGSLTPRELLLLMEVLARKVVEGPIDNESNRQYFNRIFGTLFKYSHLSGVSPTCLLTMLDTQLKTVGQKLKSNEPTHNVNKMKMLIFDILSRLRETNQLFDN
jgi:hypothetical protein